MANLISNTTQFANLYEAPSDLQKAVIDELNRYHHAFLTANDACHYLKEAHNMDDEAMDDIVDSTEQTFTVHGKEDEKYGYVPNFKVSIIAYYSFPSDDDDDYAYTVHITEL